MTFVCSPPLFQLVLRRGDIPADVKTCSLSNIASLTISKDAVHHLPGLDRLELRDIGNVTVESGGLHLPQNNSPVVFDAAFIETMHLSEDALTGYWRNKSAVTLQDINKLEIASNGLSYQSPGHGPNVQFTNVHALELAPGAFNARIKMLWIRNVSMRECRRGTFTSNIDYVELYNVTIFQNQPMCFDCVGKFGISSHRGVTISSSTLGILRPQAFHGETPCTDDESPKSGHKQPTDGIDGASSDMSRHNATETRSISTTTSKASWLVPTIILGAIVAIVATIGGILYKYGRSFLSRMRNHPQETAQRPFL